LRKRGNAIALHGHAHIEGTPAAFVGDAPEVILGDPLGRRGLWGNDPTHDPHPRRVAPPILRI
jgi:hypothetical protein